MNLSTETHFTYSELNVEDSRNCIHTNKSQVWISRNHGNHHASVTTHPTTENMLTLVNITELNLSVFSGRLTICKFRDDVDAGITTSSCVGATGANKVITPACYIISLYTTWWSCLSRSCLVYGLRFSSGMPVQSNRIKFNIWTLTKISQLYATTPSILPLLSWEQHLTYSFMT